MRIQCFVETLFVHFLPRVPGLQSKQIVSTSPATRRRIVAPEGRVFSLNTLARWVTKVHQEAAIFLEAFDFNFCY